METPEEVELVKAAQRGSQSGLDLCLTGHPELVMYQDPSGVTLLHWAAINNHVALVNHIVGLASRQASHRYLDSIGGNLRGTPLHWAVRNGATEAVVALVELGADLTITDSQGLNCLHLAAASGRHLLVMYLVSKGANINMKDVQTQRTPLVWASCLPNMKDSSAMVLLKCGADVNIQDVDGRTALHWAVFHVLSNPILSPPNLSS